MQAVRTESTKQQKSWLKKLGYGGAMLFFIKGMLWLSAPTIVALLSR